MFEDAIDETECESNANGSGLLERTRLTEVQLFMLPKQYKLRHSRSW